jgi:hypothetical protein
MRQDNTDKNISPTKSPQIKDPEDGFFITGINT